jgi:hypothetical protein
MILKSNDIKKYCDLLLCWYWSIYLFNDYVGYDK